MSKLQYLALSGVFAVAAAIATQGQAQTRPTVTDRAVVSVRPTTVTPGRPDLRPIRPDVRPERRDHDRPDPLQQRLRNACFNSPTPPVEICRRYFGNN